MQITVPDHGESLVLLLKPLISLGDNVTEEPVFEKVVPAMLQLKVVPAGKELAPCTDSVNESLVFVSACVELVLLALFTLVGGDALMARL